MWIGIRGSTVNCSRGRSSIATSILVVVPPVLRLPCPGARLGRPAIARSCADAGYGAIDVQHAGGDPEKKQHDHSPRPRAEPAVKRPAHSRCHDHHDHQFDADAEAEPETLLQG